MCISSSSNMEKQAQWRRKSRPPLPAFRLETSHGKASRKNLVGRWLYQARSGVYGRRLTQGTPVSPTEKSWPLLLLRTLFLQAGGSSVTQLGRKMNPTYGTHMYVVPHSLQTIPSHLIRITILWLLPFEKWAIWHFRDWEANPASEFTASNQTSEKSCPYLKNNENCPTLFYLHTASRFLRGYPNPHLWDSSSRGSASVKMPCSGGFALLWGVHRQDQKRVFWYLNQGARPHKKGTSSK